MQDLPATLKHIEKCPYLTEASLSPFLWNTATLSWPSRTLVTVVKPLPPHERFKVIL